MTQKRRLLIASGSIIGAVLIAVVAIASLSSGGSSRTPNAHSTTLAGSNKCVVSYAVWSEANNKFKAAITIANRDTTAIKDWKLWFVMPGDQVVSGNGQLKLDQQGRGVTVQSKTVLSPQQTQTLQFTGRFEASNAAPMVFQLGGETCQTFVSPAPGAPSQPVEVLDNGTIRLGPVPTSDTPIPGISINPSGVAVPVPVGPAAPAGGTPPSTSPAVINPPAGNGDDDDDAVEPAPPTPTASPSSASPSPTEIEPPPVIVDTYTAPADAPGDDDVVPPPTFG